MLALLLSCLGLAAAAETSFSILRDASNERVSRGQAPSARADNFTFLDNGIIRLGIDLSRGGTIGWLGPSSDPALSLLNVHDYGRSVQGSFYSGPQVFNPDGKCSEPGGWGRPWAWNPIGSGDVYLHAAPILNYSIAPDGASAIVWTLPLQWACDNVPCDCTFEQHISLNGAAAEVTLTMHTARADKTFYPGQTQELPAVYVTGDYCHLFTYNETAPWTGAPLAEQPAVWGVNAWDAFLSSERWMAFVNASGYGVGVVSPFVSRFGAGFFDNGKVGTYNCTPKGLGPYDSPTGYIAPWGAEIIDPTAPYTYSFALVLGQLASIRAYAAAQHAAARDAPLAPHYAFTATASRAHCVYSDAEDGGLPPSPGGLALRVTGPHPALIGPETVFPTTSVAAVLVNVSFAAALPQPVPAQALLWWTPLGSGAPCAQCVAGAPLVADGAFHVLRFELAGVAAWAGAVSRVEFQPLGAAPVDAGAYAGLTVCVVDSVTSVASASE